MRSALRMLLAIFVLLLAVPLSLLTLMLIAFCAATALSVDFSRATLRWIHHK